MKFSKLLDWHKESLGKEKKKYKRIDRQEDKNKKMKLTLILIGVAFIFYGAMFASRWLNASPIYSYEPSPMTGMATAPLTSERAGQLKTLGVFGGFVLVVGLFLFGIGVTMPIEIDLKDFFKFK